MASSTADARGEGGQLGGARADFVASLGRKVGDARDVLAILEDDPSSKPARDELRRRLHALGTSARMLRLEAMAQAVQQVLAVLDRATQSSSMREEDVGFVAQVLDDLPALAWGESPEHERTDTIAPARQVPSPPASVLVIGDESLADALMDDSAQGSRTYECECTDDTQKAIDLARAYAPDLMIVDAEAKYAPELVEALLEDPLTEPVPIVVVGAFRSQDESARYVALGVARAFPKPVSANTLRRACDELLDAREGRTMRITLGEPTLEQLAQRLADELRRAMIDSVDRPARSYRVPLGEGTEVLGALWGAIARVQEIVTQRTEGAIRFGGDAPEGAVALAPWLHQDVAASDRAAGRVRGSAGEVRLEGRRVVVADDDPGVTWFITDLLRTAGCDVYEALDGTVALDLAFRVQPDLIISDILMPGIDGFALCRALRRDVALRDTPVILLSWKEDLLQRVRELGASAAAYMRKESDSRAILARAREVLRPRARIEGRLRAQGEVRGRLDDLSPRLLLDLVCGIRKDARLAVRDAVHVYELEIRGEAPRKVTRTASDGGYLSGERALAGLLGVGAGRFVVSAAQEPVRGELTGTLFEQLLAPIAAARGALAATTGAQMMQVERVVLDRDTLPEYLGATPEPTRTLIGRLAQGVSPREMLLAGESSPAALEDILADLAGRGTIRGVQGPEQLDVLTPAVDAAVGVLRATPSRRASSVPPKGPSSISPRAPSSPEREAALALPEEAMTEGAVAAFEPLPLDVPAAWEDARDAAPSSLEDAVMRELSERSPQPSAARPAVTKAAIVEPGDLRPRSNPPGRDAEDASPEACLLPSLPPDAVVPGYASGEDGGPIKIPALAPGLPELTVVEAEPAALAEAPLEDDAPAAALPSERASEEALSVPSVPLTTPLATGAARPDGAASPFEPLFDVAEKEPPVTLPVRRFPWRMVLATSAVAVASAIVAHLASAPRGHGAAARPPGPALLVSAAPESVAKTAKSAHSTPPAPTTPPDELPAGAEVPSGYGLIIVTAPSGARVRLDGAIAGAGPLATGVAAPGFHDVRVEQDEGKDLVQVVEVRAGKAVRLGRAQSP